MNKIELPLSQLSVAQKLDLIELIWADLAQQEQTLDSPQWHQTLLQGREAALAEGTCTVSDWEDAKTRIKRNISCK